MQQWLIEAGPEADIVISSRARLARNLEDTRFPSMLDAKTAGEVNERVKKAVFSKPGMDFSYRMMAELPPLERQSLVEKRLCSTELAESETGALITSRDEKISIMINEEDHLRMQCILPGFQLKPAYDTVMELERMLGAKLRFAYDAKVGYLTSCPTNVGTGIRVSLMLHLPALTMTGQISQVIRMVSQMGLTVRGIYGEGTQAQGHLYQLSNQITLGFSEEEILTSLCMTARSVIDKERQLRDNIMQKQGLVLEDRVWRAYGVMAHARILETQAFMDLWSDVKLGAALGLIKNVDLVMLHNLMMDIQPASLQLSAGCEMEPANRDACRAQKVRLAMKTITAD